MMIIMKLKFIDSLKDERERDKDTVETTVTKMMIFIDHLMKSAKTDYKLIKLASVKNICLAELLAHKL